MPNLAPQINLASLNIDIQTLQVIEDILSYIQPAISSNQIDVETFILNLKNDVVQLKGQGQGSGTGMIHASVSDLRQAFHKHYSAVPKVTENPSHLLLFYAVECGLKSVWLKRKKLPGTEKIRDQTLLSKDGHNFSVWIKELRISPSVIGDMSKLPNFRLHRDSSNWDIGKAHQAWRYGIRIQSQDQLTLVAWLEKLCKWIQENINR